MIDFIEKELGLAKALYKTKVYCVEGPTPSLSSLVKNFAFSYSKPSSQRKIYLANNKGLSLKDLGKASQYAFANVLPPQTNSRRYLLHEPAK